MPSAVPSAEPDRSREPRPRPDRPSPAPRKSLWATVSPSYLFRPTWERAPRGRRRALAGLAVLLGLGLAGGFVALLALPIAEAAGMDNTLEEEFDELEPWLLVVTVVAFAPLLEESVYRLVLRRRLVLGLAAAASVLAAVLFGWPLMLVAAPVVVLVVLLWLSSHMPAGPGGRRAGAFARWWAERPRWPVWTSIVLFGFVHLSNYDVSWSVAAVAAAPIAVAPQLWLGAMFTIARVRFGWPAGVLLHAAHNSVILAIAQFV